MDTALGIKFAPPYINLSVGFLEETVVVPVELPKHFSHDNCKWNYSKDIWMTDFSHGFGTRHRMYSVKKVFLKISQSSQ